MQAICLKIWFPGKARASQYVVGYADVWDISIKSDNVVVTFKVNKMDSTGKIESSTTWQEVFAGLPYRAETDRLKANW